MKDAEGERRERGAAVGEDMESRREELCGRAVKNGRGPRGEALSARSCCCGRLDDKPVVRSWRANVLAQPSATAAVLGVLQKTSTLPCSHNALPTPPVAWALNVSILLMDVEPGCRHHRLRDTAEALSSSPTLGAEEGP